MNSSASFSVEPITPDRTSPATSLGICTAISAARSVPSLMPRSTIRDGSTPGCFCSVRTAEMPSCTLFASVLVCITGSVDHRSAARVCRHAAAFVAEEADIERRQVCAVERVHAPALAAGVPLLTILRLRLGGLDEHQDRVRAGRIGQREAAQHGVAVVRREGNVPRRRSRHRCNRLSPRRSGPQSDSSAPAATAPRCGVMFMPEDYQTRAGRVKPRRRLIMLTDFAARAPLAPAASTEPACGRRPAESTGPRGADEPTGGPCGRGPWDTRRRSSSDGAARRLRFRDDAGGRPRLSGPRHRGSPWPVRDACVTACRTRRSVRAP